VKVPSMLEVITRLEQRWAEKPKRQFEIGQVVTTPVSVCESQKAKIVGVEWGPQHGKAKADCSGWLYWLVEMVLPEPDPLVELAKEMASKHSLLLFAKRSESAYVMRGGPAWAAGETELLKWAKG
jgi:hypothetical protein